MFKEFFVLFSVYFFFNLLSKTLLTKNAILIALYIVGSFILSGFIYLLVDFALLGVILVLVYVGAVVVLFLFVIIIIPLRHIYFETNFLIYLFIYCLWSLILILVFSDYLLVNLQNVFNLLFFSFFQDNFSLFSLLGLIIYLDKVWYFLVAAFLLTVSIVGAISITQVKNLNFQLKEIINVQLNKNYKIDFILYN